MKFNYKKILINISKNILIRNVNRTNFDKKCLFIYITKPFVLKNSITHPNAYQALAIAKCLKEYHYNVDVIYSEYTKKINLEKYDMILGMGEGYSRTVGKCKEGTKRIYLATGTCFSIANTLEINRWIELFKRGKGYVGTHRLELERNPIRMIASLYESDAILSVADNEWVKQSYDWTDSDYYSIGCIPGGIEYCEPINRNISKARRNIMFLCGNGAIHKGLDIIIEAITYESGYTLHIIGNIDKEINEIYKKEIKSGNICQYGFMNINSKQFLDLCGECAFIINMSCSEGCCTAVLTGMKTGLIPIITNAEGIDIENCGFLLKEANVLKIKETLIAISNMSDNAIKCEMQKAAELIKNKYSIENVEDKLRRALKLITE